MMSEEYFEMSSEERNENDLSLAVQHSQVNGYNMGDQIWLKTAKNTFHTPSFGDEEFDIPPINPHGQARQQQQQQQQEQTYQQLHSQQENIILNEYNPQQQQQQMYLDQQQQHYNQQQQYMASQQNNQIMMIQQQQQQQHNQMLMQQQQQQQGVYIRSPTGNSPPTGVENTTTSEDSDDSTPHPAIIQAMKRPSPEPIIDGGGKAQKKPKVQKKKKKRDPNEPQKPVSAYALFFRDTQAAIKGQNPNASFGEVSKIVASMWDALEADSKNVYKKKTEAAKKDYLKALAIYRASIVSKGATEGDGMYGQYGSYGGPYSGYSPPTGLPSPTMSAPPNPPPHQQHLQQQQMSAMTKKSPLLSNMMSDRGQSAPQVQQGMMGSPMGHMTPQSHMGNNTGYMQQVNSSPHQQQQHGNQQQNNGDQSPPSVSGPGGGGMGLEPGVNGSPCIRHGCTNPAITNPEWEDEYCSNECVVGHCRDVFNTWVASNKTQAHPAVK